MSRCCCCEKFGQSVAGKMCGLTFNGAVDVIGVTSTFFLSKDYGAHRGRS